MQNPYKTTIGSACTPKSAPALILCAIVAAVLAPAFEASGQTDAVALPGSPQVTQSIAAGLKFLKTSRSEIGRWESSYDRRFPGGVDSLVIAAALSLGVKGDDEMLAGAIKAAVAAKPTTVYARAMRITALTRLGAEKFAAEIAADVEFLDDRQNSNGGWGYGVGHPTMHRRPRWTDMCNTTFAVLALSDAAAAGVKIKPDVWRKAAGYLSKEQNPDGGWGYEPSGGSGLRLRGTSHGSMTAAGVTALTAAKARLPADNPELGQYAEQIAKGGTWLGENYGLAKIPKWGWGDITYFPYFYLYMLSRVAVESGSGQIGDHMWQGELLGHLVSRQGDDGAWRPSGRKAGPRDAVHTCFALMAMSNAQKPVLINKLIVPGQTPDGSDVGALSGWLGQAAKRDARWQFVPQTASQRVLDAAPVLYVAPAEDMTIPETLGARIKQFVLRGGMVLVDLPAADTGKTRESFLALFDEYGYQARTLATSHPAFALRYKIPDPGSLAVTAIGDSCRSRVFLVSGGLGKSLRSGPTASPAGFHLAANLATYCGIGFSASAPRIPAPAPRELVVSRSRTITIARVKHAADWACGPMAAHYMHNSLAAALSVGVKQVTVDLADPIPSPAPALLWMTGTRSPKLSATQLEVLGSYLKGGGMIFVDSAMGKPEFAQRVTTVIQGSVGTLAPGKVAITDPLITGRIAGGAGSDLTKATVTVAGKKIPLADMLSVVKHADRVVAVISRCAITMPLDGGYTYGCIAPSTSDARRLAANVILMAASNGR